MEDFLFDMLSGTNYFRSYFEAEPISWEMRDAINTFSLRLLQTVLEDNPGNIIFAPVGVHGMLSVLRDGAERETKKVIHNLLHIDTEKVRINYNRFVRNYTARGGENLIVEAANQVFVTKGLKIPSEKEELFRINYLSEFDFNDISTLQEAKEAIKLWSIQNNMMNITQLISEGRNNGRTNVLAIASSLHFEGIWSRPFSKKVKYKKFSPEPRKSIKLSTLAHKDILKAGTCPELGAKWVHLCIKKGSFSVLLVLPIEKYGLREVIHRLTPEVLLKLFSENEEKFVKIEFPKFNFHQEIPLIPTLEKLGLADIFKETAEFTNIVALPMHITYFSQIIHVDIDESGVCVTVRTGKVKVSGKKPSKKGYPVMDFVADHPFLVLVVDRVNNVPVFMGRVTDPSQTSPWNYSK